MKFKVEKQDENVECGISARYVSDPIDMVIFNFTDKNLHNNSADLAFIYDATVREILRQDVRSVLREMPDDAAVFVISDHGFTPGADDAFTVPNGAVTDSGDVKYRVGRLKAPLEGDDAKNGVMFKVGDLGIPDKIRKPNGAEWSFNHVLFPRPGITLKRPQGPFSTRPLHARRTEHGRVLHPDDRPGPEDRVRACVRAGRTSASREC